MECGISLRKMIKIIRAPLESTLICYISPWNRITEVSGGGFHLHLEQIYIHTDLDREIFSWFLHLTCRLMGVRAIPMNTKLYSIKK